MTHTLDGMRSATFTGPELACIARLATAEWRKTQDGVSAESASTLASIVVRVSFMLQSPMAGE